jgi:hypothetical protein
VRDDQRNCFWFPAFDMQVMDRLTVDFRQKLRVSIDLVFGFPPVKITSPVVCQAFQVRQANP